MIIIDLPFIWGLGLLYYLLLAAILAKLGAVMILRTYFREKRRHMIGLLNMDKEEKNGRLEREG